MISGAMRLALVCALAVSTALLAALTAFPAAFPVSPAPGAVVASAHPVFSWTVPANEQSEAIYVATSPARTPEGRFYDENLVDSDVFTGNVTQWAPSTALYAGTYWWSVRTSNRDTFDSAFSEPVSFRIALRGGIVSVRVRRTSYFFFPDELDITVAWRANTRQASVSASLFRRGRQVWRARESELGSAAATAQTSSLEWERPRRIRTGTRLRLVVTLTFGGRRSSASRSVRAP